MIDKMFLQNIIAEKLELRYGSLLRKTGSFIDKMCRDYTGKPMRKY